ncbi:DLW-39 family protein [Mariniluteicoccus flavus]
MNRFLILAGLALGATTAVMVRQTRRAQAEAELWAVATEPIEGRPTQDRR